jgi:hypothetical protein
MGLISSVLHLRDVECDRVIPALDTILQEAGFGRDQLRMVSAGGPYALSEFDHIAAPGPCYVASPLNGRWLTLIEATWPATGALHLSKVCNRMSSALSCYALALIVLHDDVFFYNLDYEGEPLDGYNSNPQYFEQKRLSEVEIEAQRHTPEFFAALLPSGCTVDELRSLLSRGWWDAHDAGRLDENGLPLSEHELKPFDEEVRMRAFGTFLQLHGSSGSYPYAAWGDTGASIDWQSFLAIRYLPRQRPQRAKS